ncbi:MAG TPA: FadR/GntR family transcriptional regulator [Solirubrobacteraceae bacterium]|nr:FadR/GntR family transcriptional regulator [Solirubrobacteraceae bacterium]
MTSHLGSLDGITPIEHASVYELVVEQLRGAIHMGTYAPGEKLPTERELAQRLQVSRLSVREAVRVLEGEGYVETRRGATGGIVVLDRGIEEQRIGPYIREMLPQIVEIFEFRSAVEPEAARLAALRRTDEQLARLREANDQIEHSLETQRFRLADSQFHLGITDAAQNSWMREAVERARSAIWMPADPLYDHVFRTAAAHHGAILAAIEAQDGDAAARLMREHLDFTVADLHKIAQSA